MATIWQFAPCKISSSTISLLPRLMESCKGTSPLPFLAFTLAPFSKIKKNTEQWKSEILSFIIKQN